jgi:hypothetical protein
MLLRFPGLHPQAAVVVLKIRQLQIMEALVVAAEEQAEPKELEQ